MILIKVILISLEIIKEILSFIYFTMINILEIIADKMNKRVNINIPFINNKFKRGKFEE